MKIVFFQWKSSWQYDDCSIFEVTLFQFKFNGTNITFFSQEKQNKSHSPQETRKALFKEVDFQVASREVTGSNIIEIVEDEVCLIYILMFCLFRYDWNSSIHKIFKFMGKKFSLSIFQFDVIFITARARTRSRTRIHTRIWATIRTRPQTRTATQARTRTRTRPTTVA